MEEQQNHQIDNQTEPELLYHYTTEKGMYGILESECIWATHYLFLNDSSERSLGLDFYRRSASNVDCSSSNIPKNITGGNRKVFENLFNIVDAYIVPFSKDSRYKDMNRPGDRLSQWRGYAQGGQGYSLGFSSKHISEIASDLHQIISLGGVLRDCNYDEELLTNNASSQTLTHLQNLRNIANKFFQDHPDKDRFMPLESIEYKNELTRHGVEMISECSLYKHPTFWEEDEVRLVVFFVSGASDSQKIRFRDGQLGRTPFIEIPIPLRENPSPLKKITVGPSPNREQAAARLRIHLQKLGVHDVEVVPSKIPYRNW